MTARVAPTVSIVIPCRNEASLLPRQLDALRAQPVPGWIETIVVDDQSDDETAAVATAAADGLPGFRVVGGPGRNQAAAANSGVAVATGDVILFLDGDDEVAPGYVAAMQAALVDADFVAARVDHDSLNDADVRASRPPEQVEGLRREPQLPHPVAIGASLGIRRSVLERLGGFDDAFPHGDDTDLCWRAALDGIPLTFVPDAVLRYRYRREPAATYRQAVGYGQGGGLLERRFGAAGPGPRAGQVGRRVAWLGMAVLQAPRLVTRRGRLAVAFAIGLQIGWLEAMFVPGRVVDADARRRIEAGRS